MARHITSKNLRITAVALATVLLGTAAGNAGIVTWQGGDGAWADANWDIDGTPDQPHPGNTSDTTVINSGRVTVANSGGSYALGSGDGGRTEITGDGALVVDGQWRLWHHEVLVGDDATLDFRDIYPFQAHHGSKPSDIYITGGTIIGRDSNSFKTSRIVPDFFHLDGDSGSTTIVQLDNSESGKTLTDKVTAGYFTLDGAKVYGTGADHAVDGKWLDITSEGIKQRLTVGPDPPQPATIKIALHRAQAVVDVMDTKPAGAVVDTYTETWNDVRDNGSYDAQGAGGQVDIDTFDLLDTSGESTGANLAVSTNYTDWNGQMPGPDGLATQDHAMMKNMFSFNHNETLTVSGLGQEFTGPGYDLTIYGDAGGSREMDYLISYDGGSATATILDTTDFAAADAEFIYGTNYVTVKGLHAESFTISRATSNGMRAVINGLVIQAVPEPASVALALCGLVGLLLWRRR